MKALTTLFLSAMSGVIFAQIPNPSFETWTGSSPSTYCPTGWFDANNAYSGSTLESNIAYLGSHSAQINSVYSSISKAYFGGVLVTGSVPNPYFNADTNVDIGALTGWYQLTSVSGDEFQITVRTKVADSFNFNGVGIVNYSTSTPVGVWKEFFDCITYTSHRIADSAEIIFEIDNSSGSQYQTHSGTSVLIDDLSWDTCPAPAGIEDINNSVTLEPSYPNPANNICNIVYSIPNSATVNVSLYDISGRKLMDILNNSFQTSGRYKIPIDVSSLANGVYVYRIIVDGVPYSQKLAVEK